MIRRWRMALGWVAPALLAACAAPPPSAPADPRATLLAALAGTWSNQRQFDTAPATLKVKPSVEGEWLDHQHAVFARVTAAAVGTHVLYLEWRSGGPTGAVSRQRLWSFRTEADGTLRMDFHAFVDGAPWAGKATESAAFASIQPATLRSYSPECALRFERTAGGGWRGEIGPEHCSLTAASGRRMGIAAVVELGADGSLSYRESGQLADGRYAFRVPPTMPYRFERVPR